MVGQKTALELGYFVTERMEQSERYQVFKGMSEQLTISEMHKLVHSLWKVQKLQDVVEVQGLNDSLVLALLEKPLLAERYEWQEEQPHVQMNDVLCSIHATLKTLRQAWGTGSGKQELEKLYCKVEGLVAGNRFARHPKQKIVNYN